MNESEFTEGNTVVAFNQSNYPVLIELYEVDDDGVTFASNLNKKVEYGAVEIENESGRAYFEHEGERYYLNECMVVGL